MSEHEETTTREEFASADADSFGAVQKALMLLDAFSTSAGPLGISDLARKVGFYKSTTHRLLQILMAFEYVERCGSRYQLASRLTNMPAMSGDDQLAMMRDRLLPFLEDLYEATHETVHLAALQNDAVLYLERLYSRRSAAAARRNGIREPVGESAIGMALLAYSDWSSSSADADEVASVQQPTASLPQQLTRIRQQGVCVRPDPTVPGSVSIAAPILGPARLAIAAMSITGDAKRVDLREVTKVLREVCYNARFALPMGSNPNGHARVG